MKITLLGFGGVGQEVLRNLLEYCAHTTSVSAICVINRNSKKSKAVCDDIIHGVFTKYIYGKAEHISLPNIICSDDYINAEDTDILICCYGVPSTFPLSDRQALLQDHVTLTDEVFGKLASYVKKELIIINAVNPVDTISCYIAAIAGISPQQVVGVAGSHSTARLLMAIEEESGIHHNLVDRSSLLTCGEHGHESVPITSRITVNNQPLTTLVTSATIDNIICNAKKKGLSIFHDMKSPPKFGPAASIQMLLERILSDDETPFCGSIWHEKYNAFVSGPMKFLRKKFHILNVELSTEEIEMLKSGAMKLNSIMKNLDCHVK